MQLRMAELVYAQLFDAEVFCMRSLLPCIMVGSDWCAVWLKGAVATVIRGWALSCGPVTSQS